MFKLVHLGPRHTGTPLDMFKLVHYVVHTSASKRVVGTRLKCLQQLLQEGNVFTGVCHSFCPQGGEGWFPSKHHRSHNQWWGGLHRGGVCLQDRVCIRGVSASKGGLADSPPQDTLGYYGIWSTSGRYATLLECILHLSGACVDRIIERITCRKCTHPTMNFPMHWMNTSDRYVRCIYCLEVTQRLL